LPRTFFPEPILFYIDMSNKVTERTQWYRGAKDGGREQAEKKNEAYKSIEIFMFESQQY